LIDKPGAKDKRSVSDGALDVGGLHPLPFTDLAGGWLGVTLSECDKHGAHFVFDDPGSIHRAVTKVGQNFCDGSQFKPQLVASTTPDRIFHRLPGGGVAAG
jgi:hypothetical protein